LCGEHDARGALLNFLLIPSLPITCIHRFAHHPDRWIRFNCHCAESCLGHDTNSENAVDHISRGMWLPMVSGCGSVSHRNPAMHRNPAPTSVYAFAPEARLIADHPRLRRYRGGVGNGEAPPPPRPPSTITIGMSTARLANTMREVRSSTSSSYLLLFP
jgi:hypothetical protein